MNQLLIKNNKFMYNNETFELNDLYTIEFYKYSDENALKYKTELCICNEIFVSVFQKYLAIEFFIKNKNIEYIKLEDNDKMLDALLLDFAIKKQIKLKRINFSSDFFYSLLIKIKSIYYIFSSFAYILFKMLFMQHNDKIQDNEKRFSLIRTPAAKKKMSFLNDVKIRYEQFNNDNSIYSCYPLKSRLKLVFKAFIKSYNELKKYWAFINRNVGKKSADQIVLHYSKRIVHTLLYSYILDEYFKSHEKCEFFTGNCLDRFAIIEAVTSKNYNIKVICIPHGMEYGFLYPCGYPCDIHYSTTDKAKKVMNSIYNTDKFIFDDVIASNMLKLKEIDDHKRMIVFFTESRDIDVNIEIINSLLPILKKEDIKLYLKLHPKDSKSNYSEYKNNIEYIDSFNIAISNNICIARKSTVLVEALYNASIPLAIQINNKEIARALTFPSLQDEKIKVFYKVEDLAKYIKTIL